MSRRKVINYQWITQNKAGEKCLLFVVIGYACEEIEMKVVFNFKYFLAFSVFNALMPGLGERLMLSERIEAVNEFLM